MLTEMYCKCNVDHHFIFFNFCFTCKNFYYYFYCLKLFINYFCSSTTISTLLPHITDLVKVKIEEESSSEEKTNIQRSRNYSCY